MGRTLKSVDDVPRKNAAARGVVPSSPATTGTPDQEPPDQEPPQVLSRGGS